MDENGSGARRPPPPPPTTAQKRATPPPTPGVRRVTATMTVPPASRPDSFSGPKPAPDQLQAKDGFRNALGEKAYEKTKAVLRMLCRISGMSMQQFLVSQDALILRDLASGQDSQLARIEFAGGKPELRIYFEDLGWKSEKDQRCREVLRACGALDPTLEGRLKMLVGMNQIFIGINENEVSLCGAGERGGSSLSFFLHVQ
jgi:hypothetical protein